MLDSYLEGKIVENKTLAGNFFKMVVSGDFSARPGQFYMLKAWEGTDPLLGRPISVADIDNDGNIVFLIAEVGVGTKMLRNLKKGQSVKLMGPLGNSFPVDVSKGKIAIIGGAAGIAPLLLLAKELKGKVETIDLFAGYRDVTFFLDEFEGYVDSITVSTEDGSMGYKGYVLDLLTPEYYDVIYCCGPLPMMKALLRKNNGRTQTFISMESRMACGIGTCLGCSFKTANGMRRVCKDGPVFNGEDIII